ncbi:hypothetical protein [Clostridium paraputrificum]|uniref:hypothetical protein n=1 Tax=Clostridium paraputrificum TaxID=29363 RepID=UPI00232BAC33|nr:hypothetical protein [Clostridium paraputrificum]MDB2122253.1 hypothetical protein [Clostridium paraputrificum]
MEFITVEQFQEQPKEVQEVFLDWWKANLSESDLIGYIGKNEAYEYSFPSLVRNTAMKCFEIGIEIIPLFTEGQLRKIIEDKKGKIVEINLFCGGYSVVTAYRKCEIYDLGKDLLQAYWKAACEIASEEIKLEF